MSKTDALKSYDENLTMAVKLPSETRDHDHHDLLMREDSENVGL